MSKLIVTAMTGGDNNTSGIILVEEKSLTGQLANRILFADRSIPIALEDVILLEKLLKIKYLPVKVWDNYNDPYLGFYGDDWGLSVLVDENSPDDPGVYELCLVLCVFTDYDHDSLEYIGISGAHMNYHFPHGSRNLQSEDWDHIKHLGLERSAGSNDHGRFCKNREWVRASLFEISRGDLFAHSISLQSRLLVKGVEKAWNLFSAGKVSETKYSKNFFWRNPAQMIL